MISNHNPASSNILPVASTTMSLVATVLNSVLEGPALFIGYIYACGHSMNQCLTEDTTEYLTQELDKIENERNNNLLISHITAVLTADDVVKLLSDIEVENFRKLIDTTLPIYSACKTNENLSLYLQTIAREALNTIHPLTITDKTTGTVHFFDASTFIKSYIKDRIQEEICFEGKPLNAENFTFSKYPKKIENYLAYVRSELYPQPDRVAQPAMPNSSAFFSTAVAKEKQRIIERQNRPQVLPLEVIDGQHLDYARMSNV